MTRKNKEEEVENHGRMFEDLSLDELKNTIVRRWKEIKSLEAEKKDVVSSINDTVKELTSQIDSLVYWVGVKETMVETKKLTEAVNKALEE